MYDKKDYSDLIGVEGFSEELLTNHFTLYAGYVANTNKAHDSLRTIEPGTPEYGEMKRRFGWEFNGMRLHEYYFGNMTRESEELDSESDLAKKIVNTWGSLDTWEEDFKATGAMRGIGWVVLSYDKEADRLFNTWVNEHDLGFLAGTTPILVMDVFEHAFMVDYGLKRAEYISAFWMAIKWSEVQNRLS